MGVLDRRLGAHDGHEPVQAGKAVGEHLGEAGELPHGAHKAGDEQRECHQIPVDAVAMGIVTYEELSRMYEISAKMNTLLEALYQKAGIKLVDFKIEFGRDANGEIVLVDELTPDTCRLWDIATGERMDKDRFRRDLGRVRETYEEVASRLSNVLNK